MMNLRWHHMKYIEAEQGFLFIFLLCDDDFLCSIFLKVKKNNDDNIMIILFKVSLKDQVARQIIGKIRMRTFQ